MLTIYRRHKKDCSHREEGRKYRRCKCPIWVDGSFGGVEVRRSLKVRTETEAERELEELKCELKGESSGRPELITISTACQEFERDAIARGLREPTLYKYRLLFRQLKGFAEDHGFRFLEELDVTALRAFRASWPNQNLSALKKLEALRTLFRFAHASGWIGENPAAKIKSPKITDRPTLPFTRDEMVIILAACDRYEGGPAYGRRLRALILLLRYSGLRIRDALTLPRDRIVKGKLFLRTAKTGTPVYLPLPDFVVNALDAIPRRGPYYFWTGESKPKSVVGNYQRALHKLFELAEAAGGHAHRMRDTFAVELLLSGVPMERVSVLLGHQSLKVTERHYAPWVRARQEQLEADVRRSWAADPLAFGETKGTPEVHEDKEGLN